MRRVFADTSFFLALLLDRDAWHAQARSAFDSLDAWLVTTDYVLVEMGALMSRPATRPLYLDFVTRVRQEPTIELVPATRELLDEGLALFAERMDKEWSLTDCISMALMKRQGIREALTADRHFEQAGFHILLKP